MAKLIRTDSEITLTKDLTSDPFAVIFTSFLPGKLSVSAKARYLKEIESAIHKFEESCDSVLTRDHWLSIGSGFGAAITISGFTVLAPAALAVLSISAVAATGICIWEAFNTNSKLKPVTSSLKRHRLALASKEAIQWAYLWELAETDLFCAALDYASQGIMSQNQLFGREDEEPFDRAIDYIAQCKGISFEQAVEAARAIKQATPVALPVPEQQPVLVPATVFTDTDETDEELLVTDIADRVVPPAQDKYKWVDNFISNTALIWANQGGGKSWFVRYIAKLKKDRGYRVIVLDPDSNAAEWQGVESYHDFKDIERVLNWYLGELESRYKEFNHSQIKEEEWRRKLWTEGKAIALICEEMTTYTDFIQDQKMLSRFVRIGATKSRKQEMPITFVAHNNTQTCLGNISGLGNLIAKLLQLELFAEVDSVTLQPQASGKGAVKLDSSLEWRGVEIPKLDKKITVFGEGVKTNKEIVLEAPKSQQEEVEDETKVLDVPEEPVESIEAERKRLEEALNLEYEGNSGLERPNVRPSVRPSSTSPEPQSDPDRQVFLAIKQGRTDGRSKTQMCQQIFGCSDGGNSLRNAVVEFERIRDKFIYEWVIELHEEGMSKAQIVERIYGIHQLKQGVYKKKRPQEWAKVNDKINSILEEIEFGND